MMWVSITEKVTDSSRQNFPKRSLRVHNFSVSVTRPLYLQLCCCSQEGGKALLLEQLPDLTSFGISCKRVATFINWHLYMELCLNMHCTCVFTGITTAAVCVYPARVADAVNSLKAANSNIPVASGEIRTLIIYCKVYIIVI